MAAEHIMIYNLALQICFKKELRLIALLLMAAGQIVIYNSFFSFNLSLQICLKKELRLIALRHMAAGHILIYNSFLVLT
jgi:uncharacterized protein YjeT (DUF2065 family)